MRNKIIMVYPNLGMAGAFVLHAPLGLLYASIELVKQGIDVEVFDARLFPRTWKHELGKVLTENEKILAVGISVLSGQPIKSAVEIGAFVKSIDPEIKIVWGGPHATFFPRSILEQEWHCDYVVSGDAVRSFYQLITCLLNKSEPSSIRGISYRKGNEIIQVPHDDTKHELINFRDIPYHLIKDYSVYGQLDQKKRIFSMYSALGCPYKCSFCSAPKEYINIKGKKWLRLEIEEVVDHIEYVVSHFQADYIYFIDNDSFVDLKHVESIIDEINKRKIHVKLGFRGARINEIKLMSDTFLEKLADAGTDIMHIGAESGSNKILKLVKKNCTVDEIIECNIKLARHPRIIAAYNFIVGLPTETLDDLRATRDLMFRLVKDNPQCIIFTPNKYRPLPGTELFDLVQKQWGYTIPVSLEDWGNIEAEGDFSASWYQKGMKEFCDLLLIGSYFIDNKVNKVTSGNSIFYKFLRVVNALYGPLIRLRLKYGIYQCFLEFRLYRIFTKILRKTVQKGSLAD